jgi:hypothetical protein
MWRRYEIHILFGKPDGRVYFEVLGVEGITLNYILHD